MATLDERLAKLERSIARAEAAESKLAEVDLGQVKTVAALKDVVALIIDVLQVRE